MDSRQDLGSQLGSEEPAHRRHRHPFRELSGTSASERLGIRTREEGG